MYLFPDREYPHFMQRRRFAMDLIKIGKYIAGKRKEIGITQCQLAEQLGMSDKSVLSDLPKIYDSINVEMGVNSPGIVHLYQP